MISPSTKAERREARKGFSVRGVLVTGALVLLGLLAAPSPSISGTRRPEPPVDEVLTMDPLLVNFEEIESMIARREAALAADTAGRPAGSTREALELRDIGALEGKLADATVNSANGGLPHLCKSFKAFRESDRILETAGSGFELPLLDARLRYAEVLAFGFCDGGPDCELLSILAPDLAQKALAAARARGNAEDTARALRGLADVYLGLEQRDRETGHLNYAMASQLALWSCPTCPGPERLPALELEPWPAQRKALLEEAVRVESAAGVWTRGLIESLVSLARLAQRDEEQTARVRSIAGIAANGSAALALPERDSLIGDLAGMYIRTSSWNLGALPRDARMIGSLLADRVRIRSIQSGMDFVLLSRISATVGDPQAAKLLHDFTASRGADRKPAISERDLQAIRNLAGSAPAAEPEKPVSCDPGSLRSAAASQLQSELRVLQGALRSQDEKNFRWLMSALPGEDRLFREALRCNVQDEELLRSQMERLLLRREIWRYRPDLLNRARASRKRGSAAKAAELAELRRQRAEQRLQRAAVPAATEVRWAVCKEDWPAESGLGLYLKTEKKIAELEQELSAEVDQDATLARHLETLWSDLLASLGPDAALVGYVPTAAGDGRRILSLVVDGAGHVSWVDVGTETAVDFLATSVRAGRVGDILRPAGEALVDPIEKRLQGKHRVLLLASGPVRLLPWSAFKDRGGQYLGSRFTVSSLQSSGDAGQSDAGDGPGSTVAFVAPQYEAARETDGPWPRIVEPRFSPLPGSQQEVSTLKGMLETRHIKAESLSGPAATETAVRRIASPAVLHIAAHGFRVKSPSPLAGDDIETERAGRTSNGLAYLPGVKKSDLEPSFTKVGVALAGANRVGNPADGDGLLTASEAADLDLRTTRLVVLSGCETGFPTLQDAGGAYDLALGFRIAGARSAVASLWKVDDDASRFLMEQLYKGLLDGLPVAEALWRAKDVLRRSREFSDPKYWAPFEVFGENVTVWPKGGSSPSGAPITAQRTILSESFEDNRHGWRASEHPSAPALIRDGRYILGSTAGGWRYATLDVDLPERGDFDISCTVTKLRGDDRYFFGLLWGFRDPDNFYNLAITGDGRAAVTMKSSEIFSNFNKPDSSAPATPKSPGIFLNLNDPDIRCPAVRLANATNALRVVKKGARMQFFVNGTEIFSKDWQWSWGFAPRLGFLAYGELLLAFDDLKVSVPPPPR